MAAVTLALHYEDTTDLSVYTTGAFTPAANDLLVVFVAASQTTDAGVVTDSQGHSYTKIVSATFGSGTHTLYLFVCNALAAASSTTVTFDCTGDGAVGAHIDVLSVSGMSRTGASAVKQSKAESDQATGTPNPAFASSALTGNPTIGAIGDTSSGGILPPTSWTELADNTMTGIVINLEDVARNSGFTGTTITWGGTAGAIYADIIAELDASVPVTSVDANEFLLLSDRLRKSKASMMLDLSALQDRVQKIRISSIQDDPSPLSDVVSASIIVIRHLDDALDILDSTSTAKTTPEGATVILSDMLGVADNILKSLAKLLIESTDLSDVVSAAKILVATGSDHVELSEEILKQLAGLQQESNSVSDTVIRMVERVRSAQDVLLLPIERLYLKRRIVPRIVTSLSDRVTIILARAESTSANKGRRTAAPRWLIDLAVQSVARQYSSEDMEVPN